jgi:ribonuclease P protein component
MHRVGDRAEPVTRTGQRWRPEDRLTRRQDYLRGYRRGRRRHGPYAILYSVPNEHDHPRLGITASRKVGNSVVRHRLKRWIKETYRRWNGRAALPPLDLIVHLKPAARQASFEELRGEVQRLLGGLR